MAVYSEGRELTRVAGADLSAAQYKIVKMNSSRQLVLSAAATDNHFGVVNLGSNTGGNVSAVARNAQGTFKVLLGGTVAVGAALTSNASGVAIATTTTGDEVIGFAQEAGVSGQVIEYRATDRKY